MIDSTFLQTQAIELQRLLEQAGNDPILAPQLAGRLADVQQELKQATEPQGELFSRSAHAMPRTALFLRGGGVKDSAGIRPALAGQALIHYEKMFIEQARHDEREAAKRAGRQRRPRGAAEPELLFTGTPRGSFGLEFVPQPTDDTALLDVHRESLEHIADALANIASAEGDDAIAQIPARVLQPLKHFMKTLAIHDAELRLAFSDRQSRSITRAQVQAAAERLEREVDQRTIEMPGIFRGIARDSGIFDLRKTNGETITGVVAEDLSEEDLDRIDALTNLNCLATLQETVVKRITGNPATSYVLIDAAAEAA